MEQIKIMGASGRTVRAVTPLTDYRLLLEFDNGDKRVYDVTPLLKLEPFAPLAEESLFAQVHIIYNYTIGWNDEIDICPDCLYEHSTPI